MIPISDTNPTRRLPIVNLILIGINVLVFLYESSLSDRVLNAFIFQWGVVPQQLLAAFRAPTSQGALTEFATLITSQFIHGGWLHLIGNMVFLFVFGDNIEEVLSSLGYLVFYLLCGSAAGLIQTFALAPFLGDLAVPSIGASGAIAGVLGAYLVLYPSARVTVLVPIFWFATYQVPAILVLGLWFVQQFLQGIMTLNPSAAQAGGVGFWAHIGGFVVGAILILPFLGTARQRAAVYQARYTSRPAYDDYRRWRG